MIGTLIQAGLGAAQTIGGLFMKNPKLPQYNISSEIQSNLNDAYMNRNVGMGDATKRMYERNMDRSTASSLASSSSRKGGIGLVASVAQQNADMASKMASEDEYIRRANLDRMYQARNVMNSAKDKQFAVKQGNIQEQRARRDKMIGAGLQNTMGAIGTSEAADALLGRNSTIDSTFKSLFGKKSKSSGGIFDSAMNYIGE